MKAIIQEGNGCRVAEIARPVPDYEQVLVRVRASALNRADLAMLAGHMHGQHGGAGTVLGLEWAGYVEAVGSAVTGFQPGDCVMCSGKGGFAEYAVTDWGRVMHIPHPEIDFEHASCFPVSLQTMHDAIVTHGKLRRGGTVLIQGASSGVGLMGLQIARELGAALVIGTSTSSEKRERLAHFGADVVLDSRSEWVEEVLALTGGKGVDLVVDQLAGSYANQNMNAAAIGGRIVNVGRLAGMEAPFDFNLHALRRISYIGVTFRTRSNEEVREINRRMAGDLWEALRDGRLRQPVDSVFDFNQAAEALARMKQNRHFGKIVLRVD